MPTIYSKILMVQADMPSIIKDSDNPFFKSKYFDINSVVAVLRPIISKHGLVVLQPLTMIKKNDELENDAIGLETIIADSETGETISRAVELPEVKDPQKFGAMVTYFRRYALTSMFLLEGEDDDAEGVTSHATAPKAPFVPKAVQATPQATTVDPEGVKWTGTLEEAGNMSLQLKGVVQDIKSLTPSALDWVRKTIKNPQIKSAAQFYFDNIAPF